MHDVFTKMKKYPMMADIYRGVVLPMLQKILEAQKAAEHLTREAERINAEQQNVRLPSNDGTTAESKEG